MVLTYVIKDEYDHAIANYTKAIQLKSDYTNAYYNRGVIYCKKRKYEYAIEDFTKVIQLNPNDADAYYNRSVAYRIKGKVDHAIEDYNRAIQLNPDSADTYDNHETEGLHLEIREETRSDQTTTRDMGRNIITSFSSDYENLPTENLLEEITSKSIAA